MFTWMMIGLAVVTFLAWKVLSSAIADDKKRKKIPSRF
jgi:hypothetical protein